jgi:hypothetical protein
LPDRLIQGLNPLITNRMIPITLYYAANIRVLGLPQGLPMARAGIADARYKKHGTHMNSRCEVDDLG